jgi:hypothetical protein
LLCFPETHTPLSFNYSFDPMMRPAGMTDQNSASIVNTVGHGPANELLHMTYNGGTETRTYNSMLQLTNITGVQFSATYLLGTIAHEILHNITGLTDPDLQRKLNLSDTQSSSNILLKLLVDCFLQGGFGPP